MIHSKLTRYFRLSDAFDAEPSNLLYLNSGQLRLPVPLSVWMIAPALGILISHIVGMRTKEQMIGSYARRIVAAMENGQPLGYRAIVHLPRESMCSKNTPTVFDLAVSPSDISSGPNPARPKFWHVSRDRTKSVHLLPKTNGKWYSRLGHDLNPLKQWFKLWSGSFGYNRSSLCILAR